MFRDLYLLNSFVISAYLFLSTNNEPTQHILCIIIHILVHHTSEVNCYAFFFSWG